MIRRSRVLAVILLLVGAGACREERADVSVGRRKPNVIFLMADDLGWGELGCYGQKKIRTPHVDRLAREGMRFTHCYAGSTVCAPSRSVLMTGQHTGHTRVRGNFGKVGGVGRQKRVPLLPEDVTVAEVFKAAGYATGITGKWGLGEPETTGIPNRQGFDEWYGHLNQAKAHTHYPEYLWRDETKVILEGNLEGRQTQYSHDLFTEFALEFIRKHEDEPFFLYVPWLPPHKALQVPSQAPYENEPWPERAKIHAAMITRMDRDVGRILDLLTELRLVDDTLVFFCSDNGADERWEGMFDSSGPLRGHKRDIYEGGIRTPMVVRWPGRIPAGRVSDVPWTFADFLPTAAEVAGAQVPSGVDGESVLPLLLGGRLLGGGLLGEGAQTGARVLYWEFPEKTFMQAVRYGNWKAVRLGVDAGVELYNLSEDPGESHNVAALHPDRVARFSAHMKNEHRESPNWPTLRH